MIFKVRKVRNGRYSAYPTCRIQLILKAFD
jgi:hypothetical protein